MYKELCGTARTSLADTLIAKMLLTVALIFVFLLVFIYKYAFGSSGPNPFETDTREPLKKMVHDRKEKNKVLKQGELKDPARGGVFPIILFILEYVGNKKQRV